MSTKAVIVTALPVEYRAAREHLCNLREVTHPKGTVYEVGAFDPEQGAKWEIALVEIGPGNSGAAMEAERAISFFSPQVALFIIIAGGLKDVDIGDVVAATKIYGYESGKAESTLLPRPDVGRSTYRMEQRARAEAKKEDWLTRVKIRPSRTPRVFVAPIAAGEKVVSNMRSVTYAFLRKEYGDALAVEMEGRGFLAATAANQDVDALVVRGTSDLVKEKQETDALGCQELAARHASAFAFEILAKFIQGSDQQKTQWMLVFEGTREQTTQIMHVVVGEIQRITGDFGITIRKIDPGSVILDMEGSEGAFERIRSLYLTGQVTEIAGLRILDVRPWEDLALIRAAMAGDKAAFAELYRIYRKRVLGYISARTGDPQSAPARQDIEQNTWARVIEALPQYKPSLASFEAFLKYTASLILARHFRTQHRYLERFASLAEIDTQYSSQVPSSDLGVLRAEVRSSEANLALADEFDGLLRVTVGGGSPPHQIAAFVFTKLLYRAS